MRGGSTSGSRRPEGRSSSRSSRPAARRSCSWSRSRWPWRRPRRPSCALSIRARAGAAPEHGATLAIRGAVGAGLGPLPEPSGFASLAGSVELPGWRLEIAGAAWLPRSVSYPEQPSVGARLLLLTGSVRGCLVPKMGAIDFPICAGAELGVMEGSGFGVARVETSEELWTAALVGPALRWTLGGPTSVWIAADAVLGIERPAFHMRNLEVLYRPEAVTARAWAGLEVRL